MTKIKNTGRFGLSEEKLKELIEHRVNGTDLEQLAHQFNKRPQRIWHILVELNLIDYKGEVPKPDMTYYNILKKLRGSKFINNDYRNNKFKKQYDNKTIKTNI